MQMPGVRARGALPQLVALPRDILSFVLRPTLTDQRHRLGKTAVVLFLGVVALDFLLDMILQGMLTSADGVLVDLPQQAESTLTPLQAILSLVILAPLVEEAMFRGWMSGRKASIRFAVWGIAAMLVAMSGELPQTQDYLPLVIFAAFGLAGIGFGQWLMTYAKDSDVPGWFTRNFHWLVWGSAAIFGLFHLANYMGALSPGHLLVSAPAICGGLLLAYTRTRFGLRAAILHHAIYNAVYLGVEAFGG